MPTYDELIFVANPANLDPERDAASCMRSGRGAQYMVNHPDEAWQICHHPGCRTN